MSGVSLPVTRPSGRALLVCNPASRPQTAESLAKHGFVCDPADEPYAAMVELCRRPMTYRAVILSVAGLYREELAIIRAIKRRFAHTEIWLTHTDGRQGALAEAMRLGADGLIDDEGLHRIAMGASADQEQGRATGAENLSGMASDPSDHLPALARSMDDVDEPSDEPILSADELRALLQEQPSLPPAGGDEA
jgi:hypothetical protein